MLRVIPIDFKILQSILITLRAEAPNLDVEVDVNVQGATLSPEIPPPETTPRDPYLIINKRGRFELSRLPEEVIYETSGLDFPLVDSTLDMSVVPRYIPTTDRHIYVPTGSGRDGYVAEDRVGEILGRLPSVALVTQTPKDTPAIDLEVDLVEGFPIRRIGVSVKSRQEGVRAFYREIGRAGSHEAEMGISVYLKRRELMAKRGLVIINGGFKKGVVVSDQYIADKFARDTNLLTWRKAARAKFIHPRTSSPIPELA